MSAALRLIRRMLTPRITLAAFVLFIPASQCSTNDSPFSLTNKATGFCLLKKSNRCLDVRWTTGNRLFATWTKKCLGAQGKSVGSEVSLYDCDSNSNLQKWECKNGTVLALKDQKLYIEGRADESIALSRTIGPNNQFTITGTASGACTRTHRELYTVEGNAFGKICMFPFMYKDRWYGDCTTFDSSTKRSWCAVETKFERQQWGYCPSSSTDHWSKNLITGAYYQLNSQSALTWSQAETSCKQQTASLLSIVDPNEAAFIAALSGTGKNKVWIGLVLDPEHGWQWSAGKPFRYLRWDSGHPLPNPGHNCALLDSTGQHSWQSFSCGKKLGYICYRDGAPPAPPQIEEGFCSTPWIPYNGHCFHLHRIAKTWSDAQKECRKEGGDLVSIRNVEDQSFVISQLGYASTDELWIGLNDKKTEGLFDWSDHSTVSFTSWEFGRPTVSGLPNENTEDCVLIRGENGNWADRMCNEKHGFICMKQSATESTGDEVDLDIGCKAGWKRHGSYCYYTGSETKTFEDAKDDCKSTGSYLADVSTGVDNAFLVSLVGMRPEKYFWLGLSNLNNLDIFAWTNTDKVKFTHWNVNMPGYQQGCVAITTGIMAGLWDLLPCTNKEKYICKHQAEGAPVTVPSPTQTPPKCADGWNRVGTRNICSKFFTGPRSEEKTWFEAKEYCRAIGGDLLSIHSPAELFVGGGLKAWIGLHVPDSSAGYVWSDGSALNYQHWKEGEPNNYNNAESCVEVVMYDWGEEGSWNDANCDSYNDWLCQIRAGVTPKPPPNNTALEYNTTADGWLQWRGNQYYVNRNSKSIEHARYFCQQRHGDLASINSKEENTFLWKQISRSYGNYYIGLSVDLDGSYWWLDGTPVSFLKFDEDRPESETLDKNCVSMSYHMGIWGTSNCGNEFMSLCKRRDSSLVNTTVIPTVPPTGGCPAKWTQFGSQCYNVITSKKIIWEEARSECIKMQGNLVSIPTRNVQAFLITLLANIATSDLWIGLNALKQDGFYWTDGKSRQYTNWGYTRHQRRPGTFYKRWNEEDCVAMSNGTHGIGKWIARSCNDTNGFVCHKTLDPRISPQPEKIYPDTYVQLVNDSIKVVTKNLTWDDAKRNCETDKANLASLRNDWTQAYVELLATKLKAPLWIGLNKQQTNGYFRYVDGWHMNFASWAYSEPSSNRPCVYLDVDGQWKTAFCNQTMNSVCMRSTDVPPTDSTIYPGHCPEDMAEEYYSTYTWLPFKAHCYLFVTNEIEWADAASSCIRHGGMLTGIGDPAEQEFIKSNVEIFKDSHSSFWVGLFKTHKGTWLWLDKSVMDYTNWGEEEPNDDFGSITTSTGLWNTGRRWHDRGYICKTPLVTTDGTGSRIGPTGGPNSRSRVHTSLIVVLIVTVTCSLLVGGFFLYKRSPIVFPTFENPLYFNSEQPQPDVVDTNKLIENAEVPEPILTL